MTNERSHSAVNAGNRPIKQLLMTQVCIPELT